MDIFDYLEQHAPFIIFGIVVPLTLIICGFWVEAAMIMFAVGILGMLDPGK